MNEIVFGDFIGHLTVDFCVLFLVLRQAGMNGDSFDPRLEIRCAAVLMQAPEDVDEAFLQSILCIVVIGGITDTQGIQP